jgi:Tfp pilus assembly protein PilF
MSFGAPGSSKSTLNLEDLMRLGVRTAKAGNKEGARVIFQQVLDSDKRNERAWLWMAFVADNDIDRRRYLETALKLDPQNSIASRQLAQMDQAIRGTEGASLRLGVMIVAVLVIALAVVVALVLVITRT